MHWNEWGRFWLPHVSDRESANEAAFIVKTMAEVSQAADSFSYWCLSDIYDQVGYGAETFHGNYGLLNLYGLRKPSYFAFQLLGMLGKITCPLKTEGSDPLCDAFATLDEGMLRILIYSYVHEADHSGDKNELLRISFETEKKLNPDAVTFYRVASEENNILDAWEKMGRPDSLRPVERRQLMSVNTLRPSTHAIRISQSHGKTRVEFDMESPGVGFLQLQLR